MIDTKAERSRVFFNDPNNYLVSNVLIELRRLVVQKLIGKSINKNILDIGCGNGDLTRELVENNFLTYLDVSPNMIEIVKSRLVENQVQKCVFINSDFESAVFNKKYDIVVCVGVIAHVEDVGKLLNKINLITNDNAQIIIQYTAAEKLLAKINRLKAFFDKRNLYGYKINITTSQQIEGLLNLNGFITLEKVNYIPISPLLSIFKSSQKLKILKYLLYGRIFNCIGSEVIIHLKKNNH